MDKKEVAQLLGIFQVHYENYRHFDNNMLKLAVETWYQGLQDLDASLVFNVVQKIVNTDENPFPPKLAFIRKECLKALNPTSLISAEIAFEMAKKTIKSFGRYNEAKGLESLPPSVSRTLKTIGWERWCNTKDEDMGYLKNDFVKFYEDFDTPEREQKLLPPQILHRLQQLQQNEKQKRLNE